MKSRYGNNKSLPRPIVIASAVLLILVIMGLLMDLFFIPTSAIRLFGETKFNQMKWKSFKSSNYQITTKLDDFSVISGTYKLDVKNDEVVQVTILYANWPEYASSRSPQDFHELAIDGLFQYAYDCLSHYPSYSCSFQFDPQYGYPTEIHIDCDNPDACAEDIKVLDMKLSATDG